jgi:putative pyruvate formate lyase activating enzyme
MACPSYLGLSRAEIDRRVEEGLRALESCQVCPRNCGVNRREGETAVCRCGRRARVSGYFPHLGEEDCLRGTRGSGTIFFGGCNLCCVFCQNWETSQDGAGEEVSPRDLAAMMLELQDQGCHNINWVTPEHVVPQILEAMPYAIEGGLRLPIVYNTGGYDSLHSLSLLDGIVDIYMPDFKYWDARLSARLLGAKDYPEVARAALREMHRQVGDLSLDENGLARRGLLVRHLVMPEATGDAARIFEWLATELGPETYVNVMAQYRPEGRARRVPDRYPEIARPTSPEEHDAAIEAARRAGLHRFDTRRRWVLLWR